MVDQTTSEFCWGLYTLHPDEFVAQILVKVCHWKYWSKFVAQILVRVCHWSSQHKLGSCRHLPGPTGHCFANLAPLLTWDCIPCTLPTTCQRSIVLQTHQLYSNTLLYNIQCTIYNVYCVVLYFCVLCCFLRQTAVFCCKSRDETEQYRGRAEQDKLDKKVRQSITLISSFYFLFLDPFSNKFSLKGNIS